MMPQNGRFFLGHFVPKRKSKKQNKDDVPKRTVPFGTMKGIICQNQ